MALALKFIDGCNHLASAQLTRKWTSASPAIIVSAGAGRNGGNAITTNNPGAGSTLTLTLDAQACYLVIGAFRTPSNSSSMTIAELRDGATVHLQLKMTPGGVLSVQRNGTELANSGAVALLTNTWYHFGFAAKIGDSGSYDVWLNGVKVITGTGDTQNAGNASANIVAFIPTNGASAAGLLCDIAIYNGASYTDADFPGDCRVMTSLPNGVGNYSQWTGTYADVDDAIPDDDTTALTDATAGNISTFTMTPISGTGVVKGVQLNLMARKDDAGARTIASVARLGTTDAVGSTVATGLTFVDYTTPLPTKPGGGAWTVDDVNACEFGIKTIA